MPIRSRVIVLLSLFSILVAPQLGWAQAKPASERLLRIVPADYGFYLVVNDLRGQLPKWRKNFRAFEESAVKKVIEASPEWEQLKIALDVFEGAFEIDWPTFRDDVIGDAVLFAYRPGPPGHPEEEQGVLLLQARNALLVTRLVDRLNDIQQQTGELQEVKTLTYKDTPYMRRALDKKTQFYVQMGGIFAFSDKEEPIKKIIDRYEVKDLAPMSRQLQKAGGESALVSLIVNPRAFDALLEDKAQKEKTPAFQPFLAVWRGLEAIVISASSEETIDLSLAIQATPREMPAPLVKFFMEASGPSDLWKRFPDQAIVTIAGRADSQAWKDAPGFFVSPAGRKDLASDLQKNVGSALGLDLFQDVLPNIGPDVGLSLFASTEAKPFPQLIAALAVKPGTGTAPVDQSLFKGVQFLTNILLFEYNRTHDEPIRLQTTKQDQVEVAYLDGKLPPGLQPACALKDGYLLVASSPEAIRRFGSAGKAGPVAADAPYLRFSATRLADLMQQYRPDLAAHVAQMNHLSNAAAAQRVDAALSILSTFDRLELNRTAGDGQLRVTLRIFPVNNK